MICFKNLGCAALFFSEILIFLQFLQQWLIKWLKIRNNAYSVQWEELYLTGIQFCMFMKGKESWGRIDGNTPNY